MNVSEYFTRKEKKITDSNKQKSESSNNLDILEEKVAKDNSQNDSKPWASGWHSSGHGQKNNWRDRDMNRGSDTTRNNRSSWNNRNRDNRNRDNRDRNNRDRNRNRNNRNRDSNRDRNRRNQDWDRRRSDDYYQPRKNREIGRNEPRRDESRNSTPVQSITSNDTQPLTISEGGWRPTKIDTSTPEGKIQQNVKTGQGYLNKMTRATFETLSEKFVTVALEEENGDPPLPGLLKLLIDRIFEQALLQPTFCPMYSSLCEKIHCRMKKFRMVLLNKCQEEFERGSEEPSEELSDREKDDFRFKAKKRMLGNIKFIGELFKNKILVEPVMYECFNQLLNNQTLESPDEEQTEALCKLMLNVGNILDHEKARKRMNGYFDQMKEIQNGGFISHRIKFLLQDVEELRQNKWIPLR